MEIIISLWVLNGVLFRDEDYLKFNVETQTDVFCNLCRRVKK